jgi:hypothetical protein
MPTTAAARPRSAEPVPAGADTIGRHVDVGRGDLWIIPQRHPLHRDAGLKVISAGPGQLSWSLHSPSPQLTLDELNQMKALNPKTRTTWKKKPPRPGPAGDDAAAARIDRGHHH